MRSALSYLLLVLILAIFLLGLFFLSGITGSVVFDNYTYTKAICESNSCRDYVVACEGNMVNMIPTGNFVQFSENWSDPREKKDIEKLC